MKLASNACRVLLGVMLFFTLVDLAVAQNSPFDDCGALVAGVECVLFQADSGGRFVLGNLENFKVGDRVHVTGELDPACFTICMEGGCIRNNTIAGSADGRLTVSCRADLSVKAGETMTWGATVSCGSGSFAYSWSGTDALSGTTAVVRQVYTTPGYKEAHVTVTDLTVGDQATGDCAMHVIPTSFVEPPSVTPVLWVPRDVDPTPMVPQLERVWRSIHAGFFHLYGKTFRMNPLRTVVSTKTEMEICGGDCTDLGKVGGLINQALAEANAAVGEWIPYTRVIQVMAWGGGGWAGALGWDQPRGATGDITVAPAAGVRTPAIEPDLPEWIVGIRRLGNYKDAVNLAIAHELNHSIGWDDHNDFSLDTPPTDYEKQVALAGPFLTDTPSDITRPTVSFSSPADGATLSKTVTVSADASDDIVMDAVVLLVDRQFWAVDASAPFSFTFDTTLVGHGRHTLTAIAYDMAGNTAEVSRDVFVMNRVAEASCSGDFPLNTFHVCYYDGKGFDSPYLGTLIDHPFLVAAPNSGWVRHDWGDDEIAFGQHDTVSGVWRGTLDFPPANYIFHFFTDDGLRVYINGSLVIDKWYDQVADYSATVALNGPTTIQIEWYENLHGQRMTFWWRPTAPTIIPDSFLLMVNKVGTGTGTVISSPAGINCGTDCSESYNSGTTVTLTATPDAGSTFAGWGGDSDCSDGQVTMTADKTCTATFTSTQFGQRAIRVVDTSGAPGSTVSVPIELVAQGDENALGFSLTYDPAVLTFSKADLGKDASGALFNVNDSQTLQGRLGIALALPAGQKFAAGTRQIVLVSFTVAPVTTATSTTVGFDDQPVGREVVDAGANDLPATYIPGTVTIFTGFEGDVAPRPNGDNNGKVIIADWVQDGRFAAGLDTANPGSEFQRADTAPKACRGNGAIMIADWVQTGRYAAGLDAIVPAGGPTGPPPEPCNLVAKEGPAAQEGTRVVRAVDATFQGGQVNSLTLELEAQGEENALGFSLTYDPAILTFSKADLGKDASGALFNVNDSQTLQGRLGIALALPAGQKFAAGTRQIVLVSFTVAPVTTATSTTVGFGDQPIGREVVDAGANDLPATYVNATVAATAIFITPLTIGASVLEGEVGVVYRGSLEISGGLPPYTLSMVKGVLPPGLSFGSEGVFGTPTRARTSNFTVQVTDDLFFSKSQKVRMKVFPALKISTKSLRKGRVGRKYGAALRATGGKKNTYTWSLVSGDLPEGLSLDPSTGKITGIPMESGSFDLTLQVTDALGGTASKGLSLNIN